MLNYRKHNLWKAFVDFIYDNDKKVASSQKSIPISGLECKSKLYLWPKWPISAKVDTLITTKTA